MDFLVKSAEADSAPAVVQDLRKQYEGVPVSQLLYFVSPAYDLAQVAEGMKNAFPGVVTFGCTTCKCMLTRTAGNRSVSTMAFGPGAFERFAVAVAEDIAGDPTSMAKALERIQEQLGENIANLDYRDWFGMILFDGRAPNIESFISSAGNRTDITFVGGYASDFMAFKDIAVFLDGQVRQGCAVVVVVKPRGKFALLKTQSVAPTGKTFVVTDSDEPAKVVRTLDGLPAVRVYAAALGMTEADLSGSIFRHNPFAIVAEGEPFIRAIDGSTPDGGLLISSAIKEGMTVRLLKSTNLVDETARALDEKRKELGGVIKASINFDCVLRVTMLDEGNQHDAYDELFKGVQSVGFATFGEVYVGLMAETAVLALFG